MKSTQTLKWWCIRDFKIHCTQEEKYQALDEFCEMASEWHKKHGQNTTITWDQEPDPELNPDNNMIVFKLATELTPHDSPNAD